MERVRGSSGVRLPAIVTQVDRIPQQKKTQPLPLEGHQRLAHENGTTRQDNVLSSPAISKSARRAIVDPSRRKDPQLMVLYGELAAQLGRDAHSLNKG